MFLLVVTAVIGALAIGQPPGEVVSPAVRFTFVCLAMLVVVGQAAVTWRWRSLLEEEDEQPLWDGINTGVWAVLALFCVQIMRWPSLVRMHFGEAVPLGDELLILGFLLLPLGVSGFFVSLPAMEADAEAWRTASRHTWMRMKLIIVLAVLPLLWVSGIDEALASFWPHAADADRTWAHVIGIGTLVFLFPLAMRLCWDAKPLAAGALRTRLEQIAADSRIRLRQILYWRTEDRMANAFVAGLVGWWRYVFITDALLKVLDDDQVEMVFAHEMGHVARRHLSLRVLALLAPLSLLLLLAPWISTSTDRLQADGLALLQVAAVLCALAYFWLGLGWYSRRLELEADLWSCRYMVRHSDLNWEACVNRYAHALALLTDQRHWRRRGWLHPSLLERRRFLIGQIERPGVVAQFEASMKAIAGLLWLTSGLGGCLLVVAACFG